MWDKVQRMWKKVRIIWENGMNNVRKGYEQCEKWYE